MRLLSSSSLPKVQAIQIVDCRKSRFFWVPKTPLQHNNLDIRKDSISWNTGWNKNPVAKWANPFPHSWAYQSVGQFLPAVFATAAYTYIQKQKQKLENAISQSSAFLPGGWYPKWKLIHSQLLSIYFCVESSRKKAAMRPVWHSAKKSQPPTACSLARHFFSKPPPEEEEEGCKRRKKKAQCASTVTTTL